MIYRGQIHTQTGYKRFDAQEESEHFCGGTSLHFAITQETQHIESKY